MPPPAPPAAALFVAAPRIFELMRRIAPALLDASGRHRRRAMMRPRDQPVRIYLTIVA